MKILILLLLIISCSKGGDERLAQQEEIKAKEVIQAENENIRQWSEKMEADLDQRKNFYKGIEGEFKGEINIENIDFIIVAKFIPSMPIDFYTRVRTLDEINYELQNLNININIKIENPLATSSAVSCTIENYRPNFKKGEIYIISKECKNIFQLMLSDGEDFSSLKDAKRSAKDMARRIINLEVESIEFLSGVFESSVSTKQYKFKLKREI